MSLLSGKNGPYGATATSTESKNSISGSLSTGAKTDVDSGVEMEYRKFVEDQAKARPSEIFQNRNEAHATVVIEFLFSQATRFVHSVTKNVNPRVYGSENVVNAAKSLLSNNPEAEITILVEKRSEVDRATHPFFVAVDADAAMARRLHLHFIPPEVQKHYAFNFGVNDRDDYRYEASRDAHSAKVQFGGTEFARGLHDTFRSLLANTRIPSPA